MGTFDSVKQLEKLKLRSSLSQREISSCFVESGNSLQEAAMHTYIKAATVIHISLASALEACENFTLRSNKFRGKETSNSWIRVGRPQKRPEFCD